MHRRGVISLMALFSSSTRQVTWEHFSATMNNSEENRQATDSECSVSVVPLKNHQVVKSISKEFGIRVQWSRTCVAKCFLRKKWRAKGVSRIHGGWTKQLAFGVLFFGSVALAQVPQSTHKRG
jgi:hypothetical protein